MEHELLEEKEWGAGDKQCMHESAVVDRHPESNRDGVEHAQQVAADVDRPHVAIAQVELRRCVDNAERNDAR